MAQWEVVFTLKLDNLSLIPGIHLVEETDSIWNATSILQEAKVHFISREICNSERSYGGVVPNTSFCAGHENGTFDTCKMLTLPCELSDTLAMPLRPLSFGNQWKRYCCDLQKVY
ncbi:hypothetical protein STEG23_003691 [Scotinomys teguina]